jgi:hypothetical protein
MVPLCGQDGFWQLLSLCCCLAPPGAPIRLQGRGLQVTRSLPAGFGRIRCLRVMTSDRSVSLARTLARLLETLARSLGQQTVVQRGRARVAGPRTISLVYVSLTRTQARLSDGWARSFGRQMGVKRLSALRFAFPWPILVHKGARSNHIAFH